MTDQKRAPSTDPGLCFERFRLDRANEELWLEERRVALKPKALTVLRYLLEHPGRLITKRELLDVLWEGVHVGDAVLKSHLRDIRDALGDDARAPRFIETLHRRGYRFVAPVTEEPTRTLVPIAPSAGDHGGPIASAGTAVEHFVGREAELSRLEACLRAARDGRMQTIFITGDAGAGKTTLARVFLESLDERTGLRLARGHCIEQYGAGEAYLPLLEALERLCRGEDHVRVLSVLRQRAPSWLAHVLPLLADEAGRARPANTNPERMLREMAEAILALAEEQPLVLLLEDLQWADHSTLQLIFYLVRRDDPARAMIIGTYRPRAAFQRQPDFGDWFRELASSNRCRELALTNLDSRALSHYLALRFPEHRFPPALIALLGEKTGGNPLFVSRIVDFWQERACLSLDGGAWQLGVDLVELARTVPQSLTRALERELDHLSDFERGVLEAASVVGIEFSVIAVAAALDVDVTRVEEVCAAWVRRGQFVHTAGQGEWPDGSVGLRCAFNHGLYRQVVQDGISAGRLSQLHRRVAARLEAGHATQLAGIAAELSMHFERSQQWSEALRCSFIAAGTAMSRGAPREAVDQLARGLGLVARLPEGQARVHSELQLQMMRGAALAMTRGYAAPGVDQAYARARALCAALGDRVTELLPVLGGIWRFYLVRGDCRTSGELSTQLFELACRQSDRNLRLEAQAMFGVGCWYLGRFGEARVLLEELLPALDVRERAAPQVPYGEDTGVLIQSQLSWALWFLGYPEQARRRADAAVAAARRLEQPFTLVFSLYYRCVLLQYRRDHAVLLTAADTVLELATEQGFSLFGAMATMLKGGALAALGDVPRGLAMFEEGWRAFSATGAGIAGPSWRSLWAELLSAAGRLDEASALLDEALAVAQRNQDHTWDPELYRLKGELSCHAAARGCANAGQAEELFARALELSRERGALPLELRASVSLARLWRDQDRHPEAHRLLQPVLERFEEGNETPDLIEGRRLLWDLDNVRPALPVLQTLSEVPRLLRR